MAEAAVTISGTPVVWDDGMMIHAVGVLAIGASPGTYTASGIACDIATLMQPFAPGFTAAQTPVKMSVKGISGYTYEFVKSTLKLIIRQAGTVTPAGTIVVTEGDVTVLGGAAGTALGISADSNAGALTKAAATNRTIPRATLGFAASTAAFTGTATTAAALAELAASAIPAGVSSDTIEFELLMRKFR